MEKTFGKRLTRFRYKLDKTIEEMANEMEMVKSNISRYERDITKPSVAFLEMLIQKYQVNLNWLVSDIGNMFLEEKDFEKIEVVEDLSQKFLEMPPKKEKISSFPEMYYTSFGVPVFTHDPMEEVVDLMPVVGEISAGEPLEIRNDEPLDFVPFPFYRANANVDDFLIFRVNGLSMKPEIEHQDIVFIRKNSNWFELNKRIVAIVISGELTLKKLNLNDTDQTVELIPLNPQYRTIKIDMEDLSQISLLGELKAIRRTFTK